MDMFCYQCEQAAKGVGCSAYGICGKSPETSNLQDLLVYVLEGISQYASRLRKRGVQSIELDRFVVEGLYSTVTNVNFDASRIEGLIYKAYELKEKAKNIYFEVTGETPSLEGPANWRPADTREGLLKQAKSISFESKAKLYSKDVIGLKDLILYGLKGMAAYTDHAALLGWEDGGIYAFFHDTLDFLTMSDVTIESLLAKALECGRVNLEVMRMLDEAHTKTFGHPVPTNVRISPVKGKAILVSGHDLLDLYELLRQTSGTGINVYTHGEMLPAHGYPKLHAFTHLAGNYGGAWQDQHKEFAEFPGAILMTTNCLQKPLDSYKDRIFTSGLVGWEGIPHISNRNFRPLIEAALRSPGFEDDAPERFIKVGFGHNAVSEALPKLLDLVKKNKIRHFFLIGGCDGAKSGRNYYTEFAELVPEDSIIITLACGKYRFNKKQFGEIEGIPRLLDVGQCNDAYSAIQIAILLANALGVDVNSLPISLILSWYEQKAVCILLTLLSLGIKNIRLGPSLPAFITPNVLSLLAEKYNIMPIKTAAEDIKAILG